MQGNGNQAEASLEEKVLFEGSLPLFVWLCTSIVADTSRFCKGFTTNFLQLFCDARRPAPFPRRRTDAQHPFGHCAIAYRYGLSGAFVGHRHGQREADRFSCLERAVRKTVVQLGRRRLEADGVIAARGSEKSDGSIPNGASISSEKRFFSTSNAPCPFIALPKSAELRITITLPRSFAPRSGALPPHIAAKKPNFL